MVLLACTLQTMSAETPLRGIGGGYARRATVAADPMSSRLAIGVITNDADVWVATWDGSAWRNQNTATTSTTGTTRPAATELETDSGETKNQPFLFL